MAGNEYHFITRWRVESTVEEVYKILENAEDLARWWPSVYLQVEQIEPGDDKGIGKHVRLLTRGWLPYTLRWEFICTEVDKPYGFGLKAFGDFNGRGIWKFEQDGKWVNISYDWKISADKPLLRRLSFLLKPLFAANHRWAMSRGEESLKLELARRHAKKPEEFSAIPLPPGPGNFLRIKRLSPRRKQG